MRQKLLNKTLRVYIIFSVAVLLVTAPVFYFLAEDIQHDEADEALLLREHEFEKLQLPGFLQADITKWNQWNRDIKIEPANTNITRPVYSTGQYPNILDGDMEPYRVLQSPVVIEGKPYTLFIKVNLLETEDMMYSIVMLYIAIIVTLLVGLFVITGWYSTRLWKPFKMLLEQLEHFEINKPVDITYHKTNVDEFFRLNNVIEKLISRNLIIYYNQKEFIENAAHELQTPLAVMQAKLDNMVQAQNISAEEAEGLSALNNSLARLGRINKNLLLLSRIGTDTYPEKQAVQVNEVLEQQLEFVSTQSEAENIAICTSIEKLAVETNIALLEVCTGNLLMNAIRHNRNGGTISVSVKGNILTVTNTSNDGELAREKLFKRFGKINPTGRGAGLGLAIVKKIADLYGWELSYNYENSMHNFSIAF